jgi:hypothetical protein
VELDAAAIRSKSPAGGCNDLLHRVGCLAARVARASRAVAIEAADLLAGPIVRRVSTERVSVWVALGAEVSSVRLTIYSRHSTDPGSRGEASVESACRAAASSIRRRTCSMTRSRQISRM